MSCAICVDSLNEEGDYLLGGVSSGSGGPSEGKKRRSEATGGYGGGGGGDDDGPSASRGGSEEETGLCATTCGHIYHRACIVRWLDEKTRSKVKKCPVCQGNITRRGLRTVYLDGIGGMEEREKKLEKEVEEMTMRLNECKKGQREMSRRIDELFEGNEKLKRKNRDLEGVTRTSDYFGQMLEEKNKELEERIAELMKNREFKRSGELEVRNRELSERNQMLMDDLEVAEMKIAEVEEKNVKLKEELNRLRGTSKYFERK